MKKQDLELYEDLFIPSPSGTEKLLAAWDDLGFVNKLKVLKNLEKKEYPLHLREKIYKKAFLSTNAYLRYIAAKNLVNQKQEKEEKELIRQRILSDSSPLVCYVLFESSSALFENLTCVTAEDFFSLPHHARLAKVRSVVGERSLFANILKNANLFLQQKRTTIQELDEIIRDYLTSPAFYKAYIKEQPISYDGWDDYSNHKDIQVLWTLILDLPEELIYTLLELLPESIADEPGIAIPEVILEKLNRTQLFILLNRKNIRLREFRKKAFLKYKDDDLVRNAALSYFFNLSFDEFEALLPESLLVNPKKLDFTEEEKIKISLLDSLGLLAHGLDWVYYAILGDIFLLLPHYENAAYPHNALEKILTSARMNPISSAVKAQIIKLKLYELARNIIPWTLSSNTNNKMLLPNSFENELSFLKDGVIPGSTWKTFRKFTEIWNRRYDSESNYNLLPELYGYDDNEKHISDNYAEGLIHFRTKKIEIDLSVLEKKISNLEEKSTKKQNDLFYLICFIIILLLYLIIKV